MIPFVISADAVADLRDIWDYIAEDNDEAATRFLRRLYDQFTGLSKNPRKGHLRVDLAGNRPLLFWPFRNYMIIYRMGKEILEIVAVAHGNRDIPALILRRGI